MIELVAWAVIIGIFVGWYIHNRAETKRRHDAVVRYYRELSEKE